MSDVRPEQVPYLIMRDGVLVSTAFDIPGHEVDQQLGLCWGILVRSVGVAKGFTGGVEALHVGEVRHYTDLVNQARDQAIQRMMEHARELGANAVVGVRFDSCVVAENLTEILA